MPRANALLTSFVVASGLALAVGPAAAQQSASTTDGAGHNPPSGVWLTTDYPDVVETVGKSFTVNVSLENHNMPPRRVEFSLDGLPSGWKYEIDGDGKAVRSAMVGPGETRTMTLKVTPPVDAGAKSYPLTLKGKSDAEAMTLPIDVTLAPPQPASLVVEPKLPALRGSAKSSFDYQLTIKNDSAADQVVNLTAATPPGFTASFMQEYGSQELTSIPIKANASQDIKLSVKPAEDAPAGVYKIMMQAASGKAQAQTALALDVTGQPSLTLGGPGGRLSGTAVAGKEHTYKFTLQNTGSAAAKGIKLNADAPSEWKVDFSPPDFSQIAPGGKQDFEMRITPSSKAIAGDYMVSVRSSGAGASDNLNFRVTVETSTMWGVAGLGVIGAAVLVMAAAVTRYGRR